MTSIIIVLMGFELGFACASRLTFEAQIGIELKIHDTSETRKNYLIWGT